MSITEYYAVLAEVADACGADNDMMVVAITYAMVDDSICEMVSDWARFPSRRPVIEAHIAVAIDELNASRAAN